MSANHPAKDRKPTAFGLFSPSTNPLRWKPYFKALAAFAGLMVVGGDAKTFTFVGADDPETGALWSVGANWFGGLSPGSGAAVKIELQGTAEGPQVVLDIGVGGFNIGQIRVAVPQPEAGSFVILSSDAGGSLGLNRLDAGTGTTLEILNTVDVVAPAAGLELNKEGGGTVSLGLVSGGKLIVSGGTVALIGESSYSGGTFVKAGKLDVGGSADAGNLGTGEVVVSGGVLNLKSSVTVSELTLSGGEVRTDPEAGGVALTLSGSIRATSGVLSVDVNGNFEGTTQLLKSGTGTLVVSGFNAFADYGAIGTVITGGTLVVTQGGALGLGGVEMNGGGLGANSGEAGVPVVVENALRITGGAKLVGGVGGLELAGIVDLGGGRRALEVENLVSVTGAIIDGGSAATLIKTGSGKLTLTAANGYSGGTVVNAGILEISGDGDLGAGGKVEVAGGNLQIQKNISLAQLTLNGGELSGVRVITVEVPIEARAGTISMSIGGQTGINKTGAGEVLLSGANTYSADTVIAEGALVLGSDSALGLSRVVLRGGSIKGNAAAGQTRMFDNNVTVETDSGLAAGLGVLESVGILDFSGARRALTVEGDVLWSGTLQNGGLIKRGAGTLTIAGKTNTYSGGTVIQAGTLEVSSGDVGALGGGPVTVDGGVLSTGKNAGNPLHVFGLDLNAGMILGGRDLVVTGSIRAGGEGTSSVNVSMLNGGGVTTLLKTGSGTLTLNRANLYQGSTEVRGGIVEIGTYGALSSGSVTLKGGGIKAAGAQVLANNLILSGNASLDGGSDGLDATGAVDLFGSDRSLKISGNVTLSGLISNGGLVKDGTGWLTISGSSNTYSGGTTINAGTLFALYPHSLGSGKVIIAGGVLFSDVDLDVASISFQGGALRGRGGLAIKGDLSVTSGLLEAVISGTSGISKTGSGVVEMNAQNTYTGVTQVAGGTLLINGTSALGKSTVRLKNATLAPRGNAVLGVANSFFIEGNATVGGDLGKLTVETTTHLSPNSFLSVAGEVDLAGAVTGALKKTGSGNLILSAVNQDLGDVLVSAGTVSVETAGALGAKSVVVERNGRIDLSNVDRYVFSSSSVSPRVITVNGEITGSSIEFTDGTVLKGSGSLNAGIILSNAVLAPGNSPGTITVGSIQTNGRGSSYQWQRESTGSVANPTASSRYDRVVIRNGAASNLSALTFQPVNSTTGLPIPVVGPDPLIPRQDSFAYDQVKGFGRYVGVIQGSLAVSAQPTFDAHTAVIKVSLVSSDTSAPGAIPGVDLFIERTSYAKFAQNPNAAAFGAYLDQTLKDHYDKDNDSVGVLMRQLDSALDGSVVASMLSASSPGAAYGSIAAGNLWRAQALGSRLDGRLDELMAEGAGDAVFSFGAAVAQSASLSPRFLTPHPQADQKEWAAWTAAYSTHTALDSDAAQGIGRTTASDTGASFGMERLLGNLRVGILASFGSNESNTDAPSARMSGDHWTTGVYSTVAIGSIILDASALWGCGEERATRPTARAEFSTQSTQFGLGVAANLLAPTTGWQFTPVARIKLLGYSQDAFEESGTGLLFKTDKVTESTVLSKLGVRLGHRSEVSKQLTLGFDGAAYWVHDFDAAAKPLTMHLAGSSSAFDVVGRRSAPDTAQFAMGIQGSFADFFTVRISGQRDIGSARSQSTGIFSVGVNF